MKKEFVFLLLWLWGADSMEAQQVSLLSNKFRTDYVLERQEMFASQFCIQDNEGVWSLEKRNHGVGTDPVIFVEPAP